MYDDFLLLCRGDPTRPRRGDSVIAANWVPSLKRRGEVALLFEGAAGDRGEVSIPPSGQTAPVRSVEPRRVGPVRAVLSPDPLPPRRVDQRAFLEAVQAHWSARGTPGLSVVVGPELLPVAAELASAGAPVCAVPYDSVPLLLDRQIEGRAPGLRQAWDRLERARWRRLYRRTVPSIPVVAFVAEEDARDVERWIGPCPGTRIVVAPNGVDTGYFHPAPPDVAPAAVPTVVFSGDLGARQSEEAVQLLRAVMARVWAGRPETRVTLVGRRPAASIRRWGEAEARVEVTGEVPDIRPHLWRGWVYLAPFVSGTGVKNRVLEALAMGIPVVATELALGGLDAGDAVEVGADAAELAARVEACLEARAAGGDPVAGGVAVPEVPSWEAQVETVLAALADARGRDR